jgi:hypothetical protein
MAARRKIYPKESVQSFPALKIPTAKRKASCLFTTLLGKRAQ